MTGTAVVAASLLSTRNQWRREHLRLRHSDEDRWYPELKASYVAFASSMYETMNKTFQFMDEHPGEMPCDRGYEPTERPSLELESMRLFSSDDLYDAGVDYLGAFNAWAFSSGNLDQVRRCEKRFVSQARTELRIDRSPVAPKPAS